MLRLLSFIAVLCVLTPASAQSLCTRGKWRPPSVAQPSRNSNGKLACAERAYAQALHLEKQDDAACVDYFFQAATCAWPHVQACSCSKCGPSCRATKIYHSSLIKLITAGRCFKRLNPKCGLTVNTSAGRQVVPTSYHGFVWQPDDFDRVLPVGAYSTKELKRNYRCDGLGVSTVVIRCRRRCEMFRRPRQVFGATVVLRPVTGTETSTCNYILEFFDPLRVNSVAIANCQAPLKRDLTAPIAYLLSHADRNGFANFLHPGSTTEDTGLFMIEPYQPGKIPVIIVHGLLSQPFTWADLANEIRARPDLVERYQFWGFEYATGEPFLKSAAKLRRQLYQVRAQTDPKGADSALSRIVLVGHSMGGLVSKLQTTYSGNQLWRSVSCRSFDSLVTTTCTRAELAESFFFGPVPMISRVVYIGTPHKGSVWAETLIGRLGSLLVREPSSMEDEHAQLIRDNPNCFSDEFTKRIPTSVDLLKPDSPLLRAIDHLPKSSTVPEHTILGEGYFMLRAGDSDKVVPVTSASKAGVASEKRIHEKHGDLHESDEGIREVICILRKHALER